MIDKFADRSDDKYYLNGIVEEKADVRGLVEEYDQGNFWEELAYKMVDKEFFETYNEEERKKMSKEERFAKMRKIEEKWIEEINSNGIKRLDIVEN